MANYGLTSRVNRGGAGSTSLAVEDATTPRGLFVLIPCVDGISEGRCFSVGNFAGAFHGSERDIEKRSSLCLGIK